MRCFRLALLAAILCAVAVHCRDVGGRSRRRAIPAAAADSSMRPRRPGCSGRGVGLGAAAQDIDQRWVACWSRSDVQATAWHHHGRVAYGHHDLAGESTGQPGPRTPVKPLRCSAIQATLKGQRFQILDLLLGQAWLVLPVEVAVDVEPVSSRPLRAKRLSRGRAPHVPQVTAESAATHYSTATIASSLLSTQTSPLW